MISGADLTGAGRSSVVLLSGGVDSAVLLAREAQRADVHPVYVSTGLAWESAELRMLHALLAAPPFAHGLAPLTQLTLDMRGIYTPDHWAVRGVPPAYHTEDDAVYLAGRNIVLVTQAALLAQRVGSDRIVIGSLAGNPFPDATPEFFADMSRALSAGLARAIEVAAPLANLHKDDVILLGQALGVPLELTLSCMMPTAEDEIVSVHCGRCSKCRERREAFAAAGLADPAAYDHPIPHPVIL
jgi:7-cyano-7-deazaguanine synthase